MSPNPGRGDYHSLLEILEEVEKTPDSAFFINPPRRSKKPSLLFFGARERLTLTTSNLEGFFADVQSHRDQGRIVVMLLEYEAGYLFSDKFAAEKRELGGKELGRALVYDGVTAKIKLNGVRYGFEPVETRMISPISFDQSREEYISNVSKIKERIEAGDTYQINHTMLGSFKYEYPPSKIFSALLFNQTTDYSAFINTGGKCILSFSPELFFKQDCEDITVKPMKGTKKRRSIYEERTHRPIGLIDDQKQKAENLMIADLLRNDLNRICIEPHKRVSLFKIENYESVLQMISRITGTIDPRMNLFEIFKALYPCGSITGAPKISSMKIIKEIEKRERGLYTGTIGFVTEQRAEFNVAIRTLILDPKRKTGTAGLGSGIIWDSDPDAEYDECLLKGRFFTEPVHHFRIFETMLVVNNQIPLIDHHLERMKNSAKELFFHFDGGRMMDEIIGVFYGLDPKKTYRMKLLLGKYGDFEMVVEEPAPLPEEIAIAFSNTRTNSSDDFLFNKTTRREIYDSERSLAAERGLFDLVYLNQSGEVTEGGITNIFIRKKRNWYTPPQKCGLLLGIGRKLFVKKYRAIERVLSMDDVLMADEVVLTNALRGEVKVNKIIEL